MGRRRKSNIDLVNHRLSFKNQDGSSTSNLETLPLHLLSPKTLLSWAKQCGIAIQDEEVDDVIQLLNWSWIIMINLGFRVTLSSVISISIMSPLIV